MNIFKTTDSHKANVRTLLAFFCIWGIILIVVAQVLLNVSNATNTAIDFIKNDPEIISEYGNYLYRSPLR